MTTPSSPSSLYPNLAAAIITIPLSLGFVGLYQGSRIFPLVEWPLPTNPVDQKLTDAVTRMYATQNVVIGTMGLSIWASGNRRLLGVALLLTSVSTFADGLLSLQVIGGGLMHHWPILPVCFGIGGKLLEWF